MRKVLTTVNSKFFYRVPSIFTFFPYFFELGVRGPKFMNLKVGVDRPGLLCLLAPGSAHLQHLRLVFDTVIA